MLLFWFACVCSVAYISWTFGGAQIHRYETSASVVSVDKGFRTWNTPFPAITVCLNERLNRTLAKQFIYNKWNVTSNDPEKVEYYMAFLNLLLVVSFRSNLRSFWKYESDPSFNTLDLMEVAAAVLARPDVVTVSHKKDAKAVWHPVVTEMGMCNTFNSMFFKYQSLETWRLRLNNKTMLLSETDEEEILGCDVNIKKCFAKIHFFNASGKFYIHSPFEAVEAISNPTVMVDYEEELVAEFKVLQIKADMDVKKLTPKQRSCRFSNEVISKSFPAYSSVLCQFDCRSRMAYVFCGCRPFFYIIGEGKQCDTKGMACLGRMLEVLVNLPPNLAKCKCVPQCTEINYIQHDQRIISRNTSSTKDIGARLSLSLQVPKLLLRKNLIFTFEDLAASLGGVGALSLGISFMSVVEIIILGIKISIHLIRPLI